MKCGLDASTSVCGWAFSDGSNVLDAGFLTLSKLKTNREKGNFIIEFLSKSPLIAKIDTINLEASLSGFGGGRTSQQTLIMLSRWNAVFEHMLTDAFSCGVTLCNVNTMRKKVFGKARIAGIKPKDYVKMMIPKIVPNIKDFEMLNRDKNWDVKNGDMYDAIVCSLF